MLGSRSTLRRGMARVSSTGGSKLLKEGVHAWVWPLPTSVGAWRETCEGAKAMGLAGVIPQASLATPAWYRRSAKYREIAEANGLQVTLGLGLDGNNGWAQSLCKVSDAILACLDLAPTCMINWEGQWENDKEDKARARQVVRAVLKANPGAQQRVVDAPWWAPLWHKVTRADGSWRKGYTHPSAPTAEFGVLCQNERFVQAYGANGAGLDGASLRMLAWSRDASQYPALGTPASRVLGAFQTYNRSVTDLVDTFQSEPTQCLWVYKDTQAEVRAALAYVQALARLGYSGAGASERFQLSRGIAGPTTVGPLALAAAGVAVPPGGLRWSKRAG
jgi:hypothetical protein